MALVCATISMTAKKNTTINSFQSPDFAFPQDVIENAEAAYKTLTAKGDGLGQLRALMQITCADASRDEASRQANVTRLIDCALTQKDKQVAALFTLYAATVVNNIYESNRWQFNQRNDLPLSPRSTDMSEWSGRMFNDFTDSLMRAAWDGRGDMPIGKLKGVIEFNALTAEYYPTQTDVLASIILENLSDDDEAFKSEILDALLKAHPADSKPWYNVKSLQLLTNRTYDNTDKTKKQLFDLFKSANPLTASIVWYRLTEEFGNPYEGPNANEKYLNELTRLKTLARGTWIENTLKNQIRELKNPNLSLTVPNLNTAGIPVKFKVNSYANISTVKLRFDRYNSSDERNGRYGKPAETLYRTYNLGEKSVNVRDTVLTADIPAGYYRVCAYVNGSGASTTGKTNFTVSALSINVAHFDNSCVAVLTDPLTGMPVEGQPVTFTKNNGKVTHRLTTDANGTVAFDTNSRGTLTTTYRDVFYKQYANAGATVVSEFMAKSLRTSLTTDMGLYHPGDTVRWTGVVMGDSAVAEGQRVNVKMLDTERNTINMTDCITDAYGRISGEFTLPKVIDKTGRFYLNAEVNGYHGQQSFTVSDFKLAGLKLTEIATEPNAADSTAVVSGLLSTYAGTNIANAAIEVTLDNDKGEDSVINTLTDADGRFRVTVPYPAETEANDFLTCTVSAVGPDGERTDVYNTFNSVYKFNLDLKEISGSSHDIVKPFEFSATLKDAYGKEQTATLTWKLRRDGMAVKQGVLDKTGTETLDFTDVKPGRYDLLVQTQDTTLCAERTLFVTLYDSRTTELPVADDILWTPKTNIDPAKGFYIGVSEPGAHATLIYVTDQNRVKAVAMDLQAGYQTVKPDLSDLNGRERKVYMLANHGDKSSLLSFQVKGEDLDAVKVTLENFRDKTFASTAQSWSIKVTDAKGNTLQAAVMLGVIDYRTMLLNAPAKLSVGPRNSSSYLSLDRTYSANVWLNYSNGYQDLVEQAPMAPDWLYEPGYSPRKQSMIRVRGTGNAVMMESDYDMAEMAEPVSAPDMVRTSAANAGGETKKEAKKDGVTLATVNLRTVQQRLALWLPSLTTDANGFAKVDYTLPNENTTWAVRVKVWTKNLRSAGLDTTMIANKPVMVSVNAPRFVRQGDKVTVIANVRNNTAEAVTVKALLDACGADTATVIGKAEKTYQLGANASDVLRLTVNVPVDGDVMFVTMRGVAGGFSDGERLAIPVLPSRARVTDAINFYLNPADSVYTMDLPHAKGKDFGLTLNFTGNPMWTVVEALPQLTSANNYPTADCQAARFFAAAVAKGLMDDHPELEYKFDERTLDGVMSDAVARLADLQKVDGGFMWGPWSTESSLWITENVLDIMSTLIRSGYMPDNGKVKAMIDRAVSYCDVHVQRTDLMYVILRPTFKDVMQTLNGKKVTENTIQYIIKEWRGFDTAIKAEAATALKLNGHANTAALLLSSITQFGTQTPNKGLEFKNVRSLQTYAILLEAYSTIDKDAPEIDGIRQYLIVRKQATDWGNSLITSWIVQSMIDSGTPWVDKAQAPKVLIDGKPLAVEATDRMGNVSTAVKGKTLQIEKAGDIPAYGSVMATYTAQMNDIKAYSDGEISVGKALLVERDGKWVDLGKDKLKVGDKVRVVITVKSDRPMSNVIVSDERAATFEPVDQLPGYVYADALCAYRENRDAVTNLYIDYLPKGTYLIQYDVKVNNAGTFAGGTATAICSQAPSLTAHSSGLVLTVTLTY